MTTTEILTGIKNWVVGKLNLKQNVISDLADIRSGAQAGATSVQPADILSYFDNAVYDSGTHRINFYHGQSVIAYIDASPFIVDGMVNDVRIENGYLVIDFNTDSGKQDISIPLTDIFNPNNYYTKSETDSQLTQKQSEIDDLYARIGYYVCSTEGNVAAKTIVANNYTLGNGGSIKIKMTNTNTVNNATLNINSTGAKALYYDGERASAKNSWEAGETVEVYYDGTSFYANNVAGGSGSGDGAFDVSVKYPTSGVDGGNTYTLKGALSVLNANLSASKKKGGMSIKFVLTSDNKYVQYRYMSPSTAVADFTNVANWQGVDDEPVDGSENLVKSGGVFKKVEFIDNIQSKEKNVKFFDKDGEHFGTIDDEGFHLDRLTDLDGNPYIVNTQTPQEEILVENSAFSNIGYIMYNGEVVSDNGYRYTNKIDITSIKNKKNAYLLMNTKTSGSICHVRFFNSEDKVVLMASGAFENTLTTFVNYSNVNGLSNVVMSACAIPIDAKYAQFVSEYSSSVNIKLLTEYRDVENCDFSFSGSNSVFEDTSHQCIINDCTYKKITANNGATVRLDSESYPNGTFSFGIRIDAANQAKTKLTIKFISNKDRELKICYIEKSDNVDFLPTGKSTICGLSEGLRIAYNNSAENLSHILINVESDDSSEFFIGETASKCEPFKKMPLLILNDGNNHNGKITFTDDNGNTYTDVSQYKVLDVFDIPFGVVASDWSITSDDCNNAINRGIAEKVIYSALYAHQYKTLSTYDMQRTINAYFSSQGTKTNLVVLSSHRSDDDVYNIHRLAGTTMIRLNHNLGATNIRPLFGDNSVPLCGDTYLLSPKHLRDNYMCIPFIMWTHQIPDGKSGEDPDGQKLVSFCRMVKQLVKDGYIEVLKPSEFINRVNR